MVVLLVSTDLLAASQFEGAARVAGATLRVVGPVKLDESLDPPPALVVFDLTAPLGDLAEKVQRLKRISPPPGVVAFGPHVQEARLVAATDSGCDAVLTRGQFHRSAAEVISRYATSVD